MQSYSTVVDLASLDFSNHSSLILNFSMGYQNDEKVSEKHKCSPEKESASARLEKILGYGRFQKQQESVAAKFKL